jgi:hypothetical protein
MNQGKDAMTHKRVLVLLPVSFEVQNRGVGGGAAITYQLLVKDLEEQGHQVTVLSTWNNDHPVSDHVLLKSIRSA